MQHAAAKHDNLRLYALPLASARGKERATRCYIGPSYCIAAVCVPPGLPVSCPGGRTLLQLAKNEVKEEFVLVIDADMIMRTPFTAEVGSEFGAG